MPLWKTAVQRINDTLAYLLVTPVVPTQAERNGAHQLAQAFLAARYANPASQAYRQFSESLSLGYHWHDDPNNRRKAARALFLLWKAMAWASQNQFVVPLQNIGQINQATAERDLCLTMRKAWCVENQRSGGSAGAQYVLQQLLMLNALAFLNDNKIFISGTSFQDMGQHPENVLSCTFAYNPGRDRYEFKPAQPAHLNPAQGDFVFQAESVTAYHWTDERDVPPPPLPPLPAPPVDIQTSTFGNMEAIRLSGAQVAVTTQFTGCAFCMEEHNGRLYCAHVSPAGVPGRAPNTEGRPLGDRIIAAGGAFQNGSGAAVRVYGRNSGNGTLAGGYDLGTERGADGSYMSIVGIPGGTSYNMYAQITRLHSIRSVRRIFP